MFEVAGHGKRSTHTHTNRCSKLQAMGKEAHTHTHTNRCSKLQAMGEEAGRGGEGEVPLGLARITYMQRIHALYICTVYMHCIHAPYMTICLEISPAQVPYVHRIYIGQPYIYTLYTIHIYIIHHIYTLYNIYNLSQP